MLDLKWPWRVDHQILIRPRGRLARLDCAEYGGLGLNLTIGVTTYMHCSINT